SLSFFFLFFFFQAEDGIRDFHVTGVQTCALPICSTRISALEKISLDAPANPVLEPVHTTADILVERVVTFDDFEVQRIRLAAGRSEERRVGKECRSRWWPEQ